MLFIKNMVQKHGPKHENTALKHSPKHGPAHCVFGLFVGEHVAQNTNFVFRLFLGDNVAQTHGFITAFSSPGHSQPETQTISGEIPFPDTETSASPETIPKYHLRTPFPDIPRRIPAQRQTIPREAIATPDHSQTEVSASPETPFPDIPREPPKTDIHSQSPNSKNPAKNSPPKKNNNTKTVNQIHPPDGGSLFFWVWPGIRGHPPLGETPPNIRPQCLSKHTGTAQQDHSRDLSQNPIPRDHFQKPFPETPFTETIPQATRENRKSPRQHHSPSHLGGARGAVPQATWGVLGGTIPKATPKTPKKDPKQNPKRTLKRTSNATPKTPKKDPPNS